jgi:hypothetical protein
MTLHGNTGCLWVSWDTPKIKGIRGMGPCGMGSELVVKSFF